MKDKRATGDEQLINRLFIDALRECCGQEPLYNRGRTASKRVISRFYTDPMPDDGYDANGCRRAKAYA